jgi:2-amino-4-hydroxy-6-hydroxymethyldihydropteridine diphosphokinase
MILIGLGSNIGNREDHIKMAIYELHKYTEISVDKISSLYETKPVGMVDQPNFLNAVISIHTILEPYNLLKVCLNIESQMGRVRYQRWGPRNIDIDILIYHDLIIQDEVLQIPHPRLHERSFVLIPLQEIAYDIPVYQRLTPGELLEKMDDRNDVMLYKRMDSAFLQV